MPSLLVAPSTPRNAPTRLPALETTGTLDIYHPSQPNGVPILVFQAYPTRPDSHEFGVPLGVILDACFVIAKNKEAHGSTITSSVGHLPPRCHLPTYPPVGRDPRPHPLYPRQAAPLRPAISAQPLERKTKMCVVTGAATALQASHLVPKSAEAWFHSNHRLLKGYGGGKLF
ncbi:hypothetical protein B0H14DRAFT_106448 [Mycena olivaceomarginata]|nr:hypothetical protein B0H14DRAFT_106448 [Mycena olivaceomarginata]